MKYSHFFFDEGNIHIYVTHVFYYFCYFQNFMNLHFYSLRKYLQTIPFFFFSVATDAKNKITSKFVGQWLKFDYG